MKFIETNIIGVYIIELEEISDSRGFFSRTWCKHEFEKHGLTSNVSQTNISFNHLKGTLRGMHYQASPHEETKLVRCTKGSLFDVAVDLREESNTFGEWVGVELSEENHRMLFIPEGLAHGYQTLQDNTEVFYQVSEFYAPDADRGARYDDIKFGISWPLDVSVISEKDANWPYL